MQRMLKAIFVGLIAVTLLTVADPLPASAVLRKGDHAPPIKVVSTSGQNITLDNYKGYVLLIDFFATWCHPCRESIPFLVKLNRKYAKDGLQTLGLSADEETDKALKPFIADNKINYPVALAGDSIMSDYSIRSIPTLYVIDKNGVVVEKLMGFNDDLEKSLEKLVKRLLAE